MNTTIQIEDYGAIMHPRYGVKILINGEEIPDVQVGDLSDNPEQLVTQASERLTAFLLDHPGVLLGVKPEERPRVRKTKHTYLFARQEGMEGITAAAVLVLDTSPRDTPLEDPEEAFKLFDAACTDWLNGTEEGRQAWADSSEDFNIGDFLNDGVHETRSFMLLSQKYGFKVETAEGICHDTQIGYDHVLNLKPPPDDEF